MMRCLNSVTLYKTSYERSMQKWKKSARIRHGIRGFSLLAQLPQAQVMYATFISQSSTPIMMHAMPLSSIIFSFG